MPEAGLLKLSTPKSALHIAVSMLTEAKSAPLLLGAPGIGKSESARQAIQMVASVLAKSVVGDLESADEIILRDASQIVRRDLAYINARVKADKAELDVETQKYIEYLQKRLQPIADGKADAFELLSRVKSRIYSSAELCDQWPECQQFYKYLERMIGEPHVQRWRRYIYTAVLKKLIAEDLGWDEKGGIVLNFDETPPVELYRNAYVFVNFNIASMNLSAVTGIPLLSQQGTASWPPKWAVALRYASLGLLNLDEVTNKMSELVTSAVYSIVLNRQVGNFKFNKPVVGTGNTKDTSSLVGTLPGPLFTGRFEPILVQPPTVRDWMGYMDRRYGKDGWFRAVGYLLDMTSKYGSAKELAKKLSEAGVQNVLNLIISTLVSPEYGDPFLPDNVRDFSKIIPGETPPFPSPRAWSHVAVQLQRLAGLLTGADEKFVEQVKEEAFRVAFATTGIEGLAKMISMFIDHPELLAKSPEAVVRDDFNTATFEQLRSAVNKIIAGQIGNSELMVLAKALLILSKVELYAMTPAGKAQVQKQLVAMLNSFSTATDPGSVFVYYLLKMYADLYFGEEIEA